MRSRAPISIWTDLGHQGQHVLLPLGHRGRRRPLPCRGLSYELGGQTSGTHGLDPAIAAVAGTTAVEQVSHRLVYVGPDLQDLYGVDAATIGRAAHCKTRSPRAPS